MFMKIVCIAASFIPSNTANSIQVMKATHALAELGHSVTLLVPGEGQADWDSLQSFYGLQTRFEVEWIPENLAFRRYDYAFKAVRRARELAPDLVYTWVLQAAVLSLSHGVPTILELHDRVTGRLGPWLFKRFWRSQTAHRLLTNTAALRKVLSDEFALSPKPGQVLIAPNGVELERYRGLSTPERARDKLGLSQRFTAGYTGHFYVGRGTSLMLALAKRMPELQFLWVGGQPDDVADWRERLDTEGITNVTLTGFVENTVLPQYQAAADVLLMPYGTRIAGSGGGNSAEVASPMKMFEYMAAGRPIITSDLPVIREVLNEDMAVFCPPEDVDAWQEALLLLKKDKDKRESLAKVAKAAVGAYTWQARAERALSGFTADLETDELK
jgi:glycosyltransferase involved in cell wall biosynthesis